MPFAIPVKNGMVICPCCRDYLWHCETCWNEHHNGEEHKDYEQPKYYGQPMSEKINKIMEEKYGIIPVIKADKNRVYKEGEYH